MSTPIRVTVAGHTNTGKTSLLRTLLRDVTFGNVSDRPAVTRIVEAAALTANGDEVVELYDTPGLEDSIGLLERLDALRSDRRVDGLDAIETFLASPDAGGVFAQEAKVLRQIIGSDLVLYVVDARDPVRGKHRDELTILGLCAKPVVPVLNFTAHADNRVSEWRDHASRVNMHAIAEFDTVVFSSRDEDRLYEKMKTLLGDGPAEALDRLRASRGRERRGLLEASSRAIAECLLDVAAYCEVVPADESERPRQLVEQLKESVRARERSAVTELIDLHGFRPEDVEPGDLPLAGAIWGLDLFSPEALKRFGLHAGGAAATGAMVGLTADVLLGGMSLGAATAAGAAIGGLLGLARTHGRRFVDRVRGYTELRCDVPTLRLLLLRQQTLVHALQRRGHASMETLHLDTPAADPDPKSIPKEVFTSLARARAHPAWSTITAMNPKTAAGTGTGPAAAADPARLDTVDRLARELRPLLETPGTPSGPG